MYNIAKYNAHRIVQETGTNEDFKIKKIQKSITKIFLDEIIKTN